MSSPGFHNKYRPSTLSRVLGNESVVATLSNFIESGKFPSAILLTGPTSAGKTTMARAFANDALGVKDVGASPNFEEVNFSESRTIDDVRALISQSRLRPLRGSRRIILCDEAQGILSNAPAANAFLKPLEEPSPTTTWILSSMEPDKFSSTVIGKAISGRCVHLRLKSPTDEDLFKQGARILKGEGLSKALSRESLAKLVDNGDKTYRGLAAQLEVFSSLRDEPEKALEAAMACGVSYMESPDDNNIAGFVKCTLTGNIQSAIRHAVSVKDGVQFLMRLGHYSWFLLSTSAHKGKSSVWGTKEMWSVWNSISKDVNFSQIAEFHRRVINLRLQAGALSVSGQQAAAALACEFMESQ
jgi:DNA polymerase III gamma/tau subunit